MAKIYIENYDNLEEVRKKPKYTISNEYLKPAAKFLRNFSNFGFYDGICGGGTHNLYILSRLLKNNDLREIILIDNKKSQLDNFKDII
jgi:hypothetical protein